MLLTYAMCIFKCFPLCANKKHQCYLLSELPNFMCGSLSVLLCGVFSGENRLVLLGDIAYSVLAWKFSVYVAIIMLKSFCTLVTLSQFISKYSVIR